MGKLQRKGPLGRPSSIWDDNIKIDVQEVGWEDVEWSSLAQDRDKWQAVLNTVMNLRVL